MELKDLVGEHFLSGLDSITLDRKDEYGEERTAFRFVLDDKTYMAIEDPSDGYRSYLEGLETTDEKVQYTFPPQKVIGRMRVKENREEWDTHEDDVIEFVDSINGKVVLAIGTDNVDDYYPSCVLDWNPENMSINNQ